MVHLVYQVTDFISGCNLLFQMRQNDLPLAISPSLQEIPLFLFKKKKKRNKDTGFLVEKLVSRPMGNPINM